MESLNAEADAADLLREAAEAQKQAAEQNLETVSQVLKEQVLDTGLDVSARFNRFAHVGGSHRPVLGARALRGFLPRLAHCLQVVAQRRQLARLPLVGASGLIPPWWNELRDASGV